MGVFPLYARYMKFVGSILIFTGVAVAVVGLMLYLGVNLSWFGKLPGDIRIIRPNYSLYFPVTTCIVLSIFISLILYIIKMLR
jgi:hypothetical protein